MRKSYKKPIIFMESFEVSEHISTHCGSDLTDGGLGKPTHYDKHVCAWQNKYDILFISGNNACVTTVSPDEKVNGVCYNTPDGTNMIFAS